MTGKNILLETDFGVVPAATEVRCQLVAHSGYTDDALPTAETIGTKLNDLEYSGLLSVPVLHVVTVLLATSKLVARKEEKTLARPHSGLASVFSSLRAGRSPASMTGKTGKLKHDEAKPQRRG